MYIHISREITTSILYVLSIYSMMCLDYKGNCYVVASMLQWYITTQCDHAIIRWLTHVTLTVTVYDGI